jgi:hypothetical protein
MEKILEGMAVEDKQELISSMMSAMMSQMFGGEGGMPSMMMRMMRSMIGGESARFFHKFYLKIQALIVSRQVAC